MFVEQLLTSKTKTALDVNTFVIFLSTLYSLSLSGLKLATEKQEHFYGRRNQHKTTAHETLSYEQGHPVDLISLSCNLVVFNDKIY